MQPSRPFISFGFRMHLGTAEARGSDYRGALMKCWTNTDNGCLVHYQPVSLAVRLIELDQIEADRVGSCSCLSPLFLTGKTSSQATRKDLKVETHFGIRIVNERASRISAILSEALKALAPFRIQLKLVVLPTKAPMKPPERNKTTTNRNDNNCNDNDNNNSASLLQALSLSSTWFLFHSLGLE